MPPYDSALEEIKDRIDIVDFVTEYIHLKKTGQNWKGLCPFHSEKTPSFTVSSAKQIFHCFGCGNGGDIFTFVMQHEGISFPEAVKMLAQRAGVTLKASQRESAQTGEKELFLAIHKHALVLYRHQLKNAQKAMQYLKSRGINAEAAGLFSLGYAPRSWDTLLAFLRKKGFGEETIRKAGLISRGKHGYFDTFRDRIIFPIYDLKGDVVAFGGRAIDGSEPKYLNSPETLLFNKRRVLYGLHHAKSSIKDKGYALFMEGYLDVITAHVHGFSNSVAPLGTACTQEHARLIKRFTEDVIIVFDSDQAGVKAAKSAGNILLENDINVKILSVPDNEDPDSYLRKKGKDAFRNLLDNPLSIVDFYLKQRKDKHLVARETLETISRIANKVLQGEYIKALSDKLGIDERFIIEEFRTIRRQPQDSRRREEQSNQKTRKKRPLDEMYLIQLMLQLPDKTHDIFNVVSAEDLTDSEIKELFKKIKNGSPNLDALLTQCDEKEKELLTEISLKEDLDNPEKILSDCIKRFKDNRRKVLLHELEVKIKEAESKKNLVLLKKLQKEQYDLRKSQTSKQ